MARTRRKAHTRIVPDSVITDMRSLLPRLVARIATAIQDEVEAYAGPVMGPRRTLIETTLRAGLQEFIDRVGGKARPSAEVNLRFRNMGHDIAIDGHTLEALRSAFDVATREVWEELHAVALRHSLPVSLLGRLGDALFEQVGHLRDEVEIGYRVGWDERDADFRVSRGLLAQRLLDGSDEAELGALASVARWLLPEEVLVICMSPQDGGQPAEPNPFQVDALVVADSPYVLWLCDARMRDEALRIARASLGSGRMSVSIPMPPTQVGTAARLAKRAQQLARQGLIAPSDTIDCADHEEALWLHSEPVLRERMAERLLAPLAAETPHRRRILALTLLIWLEQRASAPTIAHELGVHPQTVRHRLRQLDAMFDARLSDPDVAFPMLLALKATLPAWLAVAPNDDEP